MIVPAPEPWSRAIKRAAQEYDVDHDKVSFYDANRKLVGWVIIRKAEKDDSKNVKRRGAITRVRRLLTCVNACTGIPSEVLNEGVLGLAIDLMRRACRYGDLNMATLPDRIAANMDLIYHNTILTQESPHAKTERNP